MKTDIFIFGFNRPDLLKPQIDSLRRNIKSEYSINVVCDYRTPEHVGEFLKICCEERIPFYSHKSEEQSSPSAYHGASVTWAYNEIISKESTDYAFLLDHDMFLINDFDIDEYMSDCDISGLSQTRGSTRYVWPGLMIMDMKKVKKYKFDFLPCVVDGHPLDTGGGNYPLVQNLNFKPTDVEYPDTFNGINLLENDDGYGFELHLNQKFVHFRNASSWHNQYNVNQSSAKNGVIRIITESFCNGQE